MSCNSDSRNIFLGGVDVHGPLSESSNAGQDCIRRLGPDEGLWAVIVSVNELANGRFEFGNAPMGAAPNLLVR